MIDPIGAGKATLAAAPITQDSGTGGFSAALDAARKAEQRAQQHATELDSIKSKGFSAWVRDTQQEALKEKLRKMVMADMGLDEDSLSRLSGVMREILEKKINEEIEQRMQEMAATDDQDKQKNPVTAAAATEPSNAASAQPVGKKDQDGKTVPVIPALSWPGAASLF